MFRKRYATIHGTSYTYDRISYPCKKKKNKRQIQKKRGLRRGLGFGNDRDHECVSIDRFMTYDDGLSGKYLFSVVFD